MVKKKRVLYKKCIESLDELHQVIDAFEILGKEYKIVKRVEWIEPKPPLPTLPMEVWIVEELESEDPSGWRRKN
ncbi:hypothetical protein [Bacillus cereus]|uniref:hypothetical protein n=1 Tax=Bacillus cereus TaxID=1396 RepID=UPI00211D7842|nr:hypothetical protein [Bacillus cereus]